jgi:magnesium-transporting ATPase (P-type)
MHLLSKSKREKLLLAKQNDLVTEFMKVMSLAHECVKEKNGDKVFYQGPSPDEVTLVEFSKCVGFTYQGGNDQCQQLEFNGKLENFDVYRRMEFSSDRKRMSILIRDPTDKKIKLYVKGADSVILERLDRTNCLEQNLNHSLGFVSESSKMGLRTLLVAMRVLDMSELASFISECERAERDVLRRDFLLEEIYSKFEENLTLLGATAVEDRL